MDGSKKFLLSVLVATVIADFGVFSKAVPDDDGKVRQISNATSR